MKVGLAARNVDKLRDVAEVAGAGNEQRFEHGEAARGIARVLREICGIVDGPVSGGPRSLAPNLLAIPVLMVAARFSNRGLVVGAPISAVLVLATTLGVDPATGEKISLRSGRFGPYVQLGEGPKPKRSGIPHCSSPTLALYGQRSHWLAAYRPG